MDIARDLIVAAVAAGGAWAAVKTELRLVWKFLDALEKRVERAELRAARGSSTVEG